jgi:glutathione synthase/RimK-type ligase-like ATP-grasp enzyme
MRKEKAMRIAFVLKGRAAPHEMWSDVGRRLRERGASVEYIHPDSQLRDLSHTRVEHDLYVLKYTSGMGLSLAGALHAAGAAILNPYPVAALCRDKILTTAALAAGGVPMPDTWVTGDPTRLAGLLDDGPIVIKPYTGSRGVGVTVVRHPNELDDLPLESGPLFIQRYHQPEGVDRKMYVIGSEVFCVERVWPTRTYEEKLGRSVEPSEEMRDIARLCASAIGADIFGFDIVYSDGVPYVVDVSSFPGFKGVPDAPQLLADAIDAAAPRVMRGDLLVAGAER